MSRLTITALGTLTLQLKDKPLTGFRSAKTQALLLYLVAERNHAHRREQLVDLLWPTAAPDVANTNFRQSLSRLRRALKQAEVTPPFLLDSRQTVQIHPEAAVAFDVAEFQYLLERDRLEEAVQVYQGEFTAGFSCDSERFEAWQRQQREYLHRQALEALFRLGQKALDRGPAGAGSAQSLARRQLALEPWREPAHCQLMTALALSDDRPAALVQYDICCDVLADELGVPPSPETLALFESIRDGNLQPQLPEPAESLVESSEPLPLPTTPFIGREAEIERLTELFLAPEHPLITVVGPGGMGKTRLAIETGRRLVINPNRYQDGIFFVSLAELNDTADIPAAIAEGVGFRLDEQKDARDQIFDYLQTRSPLLILDNMEHLLPDGAAFVADLIQVAPRSTLCVTTRQRLGLASESVISLGGLPVNLGVVDGSAPQLFLQAARRSDATFELKQEQLPLVADICRMVQGAPLAVMLAAAWVDVLPLATIATQIGHDVDFLAADWPDLPARQRSIRATFDYSWDLLTSDEQRTFARLSVFRGGFSREAAGTVGETSLRLLARLVGKSLLHYDRSADRYQMHELLRQFAAEKLAVFGEEADVQSAHSAYFLETLAAMEANGRRIRIWDPYLPFATDYENLRAAWRDALERQDLTLLNRALHALHRFHEIRARDLEALALFRTTLTRLSDETDWDKGTPAERAYLQARIWNRLITRDPGPAGRNAAEHLPLFRQAGDEFEEALALERLLPGIYRSEGLTVALETNQRIIDILRRLDRPRLSFALFYRSGLLRISGAMDEANNYSLEGVTLARKFGDHAGAGFSLLFMGIFALFYRGANEAAENYFAESIREGRQLVETGYPPTTLLNGLVYKGVMHLFRGSIPAAEETNRDIMALARHSNHPFDIAARLGLSCLLNVTAGRYDLALEQATIIVTQPAGSYHIVSLALLSLTLASCATGDFQRAEKILLERMALYIHMRRTPELLYYMPAAAWLLLNRGLPEEAAGLMTLAEKHPSAPTGWWSRLDVVHRLNQALQKQLPSTPEIGEEIPWTEAKFIGKISDLWSSLQ